MGIIDDLPRSGRKKISDDVVAEVSIAATAISENNLYGECSMREISTATNVPHQTVWKIMRKTLNRYPYQVQRLHELYPGDYARRLEFARNFLTRVQFDGGWLDKILWSDEANFTLTGQVNKHNCRIWSDRNQNPNVILEQPLHAEKVTVW